MKLFYITASFPFGIGESFLIQELEALKNTGIEIFIIPTLPRGKLRKDWEIISDNYTLFIEKPLYLKLLFYLLRFMCLNPGPFYKLLMLLKGSTFIQLMKNLAVLPKSIYLKYLIEKEKPEHIHVHWGATPSTAAMLAAFGTSVPWSLSCHRWDIYENNLLKKKSENSKFIRFISEKGKMDALKFKVLPKKSFVIPMGTKISKELNFPLWQNKGDEFKIICPANLIPVKGHIYLIEAIHLLLIQGYRVKLKLAGEGYLKNKLENIIKEKKITNNIEFLGNLDHNALLDLYAEAKIQLMVLPSIDLGNGEHEGVPVSLMEAMSYGVPVISTETGSINELLPKESGLTVPEKNSFELAQKIKSIYDNPEEYIRISLLCRNLIQKDWNVNLSSRKLMSLIKK
jgi:colanic acid/amylovoran biosynthesis glycosyltransferase